MSPHILDTSPFFFSENLTYTLGRFFWTLLGHPHWLDPEYPFCAYSHPKTYAAYPVVSIEFRLGLFEVVVRLVSAVQRGRCAGFACPSYLATDTYPARPLLST